MSKKEQDLQLAITEAIEKSLPKQVGEVLQSELQELARLRVENEKLLKEVTDRELLINDQRNLLATQKEELAKHDDLDRRVKKIEEQENKQVIERLQYQLDAEKNKTEFAKDVSMGLVRNIEYRKNVFAQTTPRYDGNNIYRGDEPTEDLNSIENAE